MHVAIWEFYNGIIPDGYVIHHIDFNKENNDISNLIMMKRSDHNKLHAIGHQRTRGIKRFNNTTGECNIDWHYNKFRVRLNVNTKTIHVGRFNTFEEAIKARDEAIENLYI